MKKKIILFYFFELPESHICDGVAFGFSDTPTRESIHEFINNHKDIIYEKLFKTTV